jgi:hypothetical protein
MPLTAMKEQARRASNQITPVPSGVFSYMWCQPRSGLKSNYLFSRLLVTQASKLIVSKMFELFISYL